MGAIATVPAVAIPRISSVGTSAPWAADQTTEQIPVMPVIAAGVLGIGYQLGLGCLPGGFVHQSRNGDQDLFLTGLAGIGEGVRGWLDSR